MLRRCHKDYDPQTARKYRDLFAGGRRFRAAVKDHLLRHEAEPDTSYAARVRSAHYLNYSARIVNFFASNLLCHGMDVGLAGGEPLPDFYPEFIEDCDGRGTSLDSFCRQRFVDAMVDGCAYWRVDLPTAPPDALEPLVRREWEEMGLGRAVFMPVPYENITNWECDDAGGYLWLLEHCRVEQLARIEDESPT